MIDVTFAEGDEDFAELLDFYNKIGQEALFMDHYTLSSISEYSPVEWKEFLQDPRVSAFIAEETELLKRTKAMSMLKTVDTNKNVGQAQLLNTLLNQTKETPLKEGPVFIYTHVPLNANEEKAGNVRPYEQRFKSDTSEGDEF